MSRELFETIRVENFSPFHIEYHNKRFNESRKALFGVKDEFDLSSIITPPNEKLLRCRIVYDKDIISINYFEYLPKKISTIGIVKSDLDYRFKYNNREEINMLLSKYPQVDEIIIEKDGYLTDSSIANIAFFDGRDWITPKKPLLNGTTRERLLDVKFLRTADIKSSDIESFSGFALMNAMIEFSIQNNIYIKVKND